MKSESLIYLTVLFSAIYFGFMKWIISQPIEGMSFFLIVTSTCLFVAWLIVSFITAEDITETEDAQLKK
jgi:TM2 domain-containing membrane protein YozV